MPDPTIQDHGVDGNRPLLTVQGLSCRFGGLLAVDSLNLEITSNSIHALIGPNGAGKSTAVNLLSGFLKADSGRIILDGGDITDTSADRIARAGMARTFQNGRLFARLSVLDNILIGADSRFRGSFVGALIRNSGFRKEERDMREFALSLLATLRMDDDAARSVTSLSYGKQRQVEIARALISRPKVLLLDEPAAGMNSGEVEGLIELIDRLRRQGTTILLIEHNMGMVMRLADRISVLCFGKKIAEGKPVEIRNDEQVIAAYLGSRKSYARV
jgi:ABC-type branched-subunit amino acid transport system ATPase component